jgi:hypothetical protein
MQQPKDYRPLGSHVGHPHGKDKKIERRHRALARAEAKLGPLPAPPPAHETIDSISTHKPK